MKKLFFKSVATFIICISFLTSCNKKEVEFEQPEGSSAKSIASIKKLAAEQSDLQFAFAKILAKAIHNDASLRAFIKQEALKKFNLDYDVLYHAVKDVIISENQTFRDKLLRFADSPQQLSNIESQLPLLTLYVPTLPSGFSAEKWNTITEVPLVCPAIQSKEKEMFFYNNSDTVAFKIPANLVPGFPVIAVKNNERVKLSSEYKGMLEKGPRVTADIITNTFSYKFIDESFNVKKSINLKSHNATTKSIAKNSEQLTLAAADYLDYSTSVHPDIVSSFSAGVEWQRDNIYYGLTPTQITGPLRTNVQEYLTELTFVNGMQAYNEIADQASDPQTPPLGIGGPPSWTEGHFEFAFTFHINSTNGLGPTITKQFPVDPEDMFWAYYERVPRLVPKVWQLKYMNPKRYVVNLPVARWDLRTTGYGWRVTVSEVDPSQTITSTNTNQTQYAANFGVDDLFKKIGLKFGASATTTNTQTYTVVTHYDDDQLGEAAVYFSDPVITNLEPGFIKRPYYNTGWVLFGLSPNVI